MPDRLRDHGTVPPLDRVRDLPADGYFFPNEVAHMLRIVDIDYHQLRRLFRLVREQSGTTLNTGWSRYTLTDIAAVEVAIRLCGGKDKLGRGRRLRIKPVQDACMALHQQGIANPLLDVPLARQGQRILAYVGGTLYDPVTGQTALRAALPLTLMAAGTSDPLLADLLRAESRRKSRRSREHNTRGVVVVGQDSDEAAALPPLSMTTRTSEPLS